MSAKEMFEKLGYKERTEEFKNDKLIAITYADYENGNWIEITNKTIKVVKNRRDGCLFVSELQAINKQIEELGWDND